MLADLRRHHEVQETCLLDADAAVLWQDYRGLNRDITMFCNSIGMPTIVMQHGFNQTTDYAPPGEGKPAQFPLFASRAMVWGKAEKERMVNSGYDPDRIAVTGCPIFDRLPERRPHAGVNVVFFPVKWDREIPENLSVLRALLETGRYHVTTKLLSGRFDERRYAGLHKKYGGRMIATSPDSEKHIESIYELLEIADVFVMPWDSTAALFAYCMDIPVVFADVVQPRTLLRSGEKYIFKPSGGGHVAHSIQELAAAVDFCVEHPEHMRVERLDTARGHAAAGLPGTALERVLNTVRDCVDTAGKRSVGKLFYQPLEYDKLVSLSGEITDLLEEKGNRPFRAYAEKIPGTGTALVMEAVYGLREEFVVAPAPGDIAVSDLRFALERDVSFLVGGNASPVRLEEMGNIVGDETLDVIFEVNYPRDREELKRKASEFARTLKNGGRLYLFMRNPRALKKRLKRNLGLEAPAGEDETSPVITEVLQEFESAKLSLKKYEAVHPGKLYIPVRTPEARRKMKLIGLGYRLAKNLVPDSAAGFYTAVFIK